ncbi:MAG: tRNA 5-methoxyuridine(34)/uridine 5-oxyacetic acid(34) synthase CmoB [Gammaproteobacteria bacterium]|nr:tRNA 5-methoxyuridine(34)/uridine 5-oxyacetic acid(34) synthase CmoB [Gammaproteobacteria bacterium]MDH5593519.1 tRNA 5-methoxyuridine(34)/uridine 5-oxyacetic acid(34) synthase CmoB [Gammaproteobacteria bacterium]
MINIESLVSLMQADKNLIPWAEILPEQMKKIFLKNPHGDLPRWNKTIDTMIRQTPSSTDFNSDAVRIGNADDITQAQRDELISQLKEFMPWRKGPFELFGIHIDTEWRSDWKWNRIKDHIKSLAGKTVLDVGCSNGYHAWRMYGAGAKMVIGIDPTMIFVMQHQVMKKYTGDRPVYVLPLGIDDVPQKLKAFDTVFSMGVLYHRRDPLEHLKTLHDALKKGGELILETLVIEGGNEEVLMPKDRYAMMRNVHNIPSCDMLEQWLVQEKFKNIRFIDITATTIEEQHTTEWMEFQSLQDFLDPKDNTKTIEGYPAPVRAIVVAEK